MDKTLLLLLLCLVPALTAVDIALESELSDDEMREEVRDYVYALESLIEVRIEELVTLVPPGEVESLLEQHYQWKLERDLECRRVGLRDSNPLAELHCRVNEGERYYERRQGELDERSPPRDEDAPPLYLSMRAEPLQTSWE